MTILTKAELLHRAGWQLYYLLVWADRHLRIDFGDWAMWLLAKMGGARAVL